MLELLQLLSNEEILHSRDSNGNTLLHISAIFGHYQLVQLLIEKGLQVNDKNNSGETPLFGVSRGGFLKCLQILLENGADATIKNNLGETASKYVNNSNGRGCASRLAKAEGGGHTRIGRAFGSRMSENKVDESVVSDDLSSEQYAAYLNPYKRKMLWFTQQQKPGISVVTYNILADDYVKTNYFPWSSLDVLKWEFRKNNIIKKIVSMNSDVICLQEVDHYEELQQNLQSLGYLGVYLKRTGLRRDGCAIFFKESRWNLVDKLKIEFNELGK